MGIFSKDKNEAKVEDFNVTSMEVNLDKLQEDIKKVKYPEFDLLKQRVHNLHAKDIHEIIQVAKELQRYAKARL